MLLEVLCIQKLQEDLVGIKRYGKVTTYLET